MFVSKFATMYKGHAALTLASKDGEETLLMLLAYGNNNLDFRYILPTHFPSPDASLKAALHCDRKFSRAWPLGHL